MLSQCCRVVNVRYLAHNSDAGCNMLAPQGTVLVGHLFSNDICVLLLCLCACFGCESTRTLCVGR